jgi:heme exporter protein CcmD
MTHATFIIASYAIAGLAVLGATVAIVLDYHRLKAALQKIGAPVDQREDEA